MTSVVDLDQTIGRAIIFQQDWVINRTRLLEKRVYKTPFLTLGRQHPSELGTQP